MDETNQDPTPCQKFIDAYQNLKISNKELSEAELFEKTEKVLESEGLILDPLKRKEVSILFLITI